MGSGGLESMQFGWFSPWVQATNISGLTGEGSISMLTRVTGLSSSGAFGLKAHHSHLLHPSE